MDYCQDSILIEEHYSEINKSQERDMNDLNANRKSRAISENKKEVKVISMEYKKIIESCEQTT